MREQTYSKSLVVGGYTLEDIEQGLFYKSGFVMNYVLKHLDKITSCPNNYICRILPTEWNVSPTTPEKFIGAYYASCVFESVKNMGVPDLLVPYGYQIEFLQSKFVDEPVVDLFVCNMYGRYFLILPGVIKTVAIFESEEYEGTKYGLDRGEFYKLKSGNLELVKNVYDSISRIKLDCLCNLHEIERVEYKSMLREVLKGIIDSYFVLSREEQEELRHSEFEFADLTFPAEVTEDCTRFEHDFVFSKALVEYDSKSDDWSNVRGISFKVFSKLVGKYLISGFLYGLRLATFSKDVTIVPLIAAYMFGLYTSNTMGYISAMLKVQVQFFVFVDVEKFWKL